MEFDLPGEPWKGKAPPRCTPARVHSISVSFPYICTTKLGPTVTLHPVAAKGSVGAGGRDGCGGREPNPLQLPPRGCGGGSVADFQLPPPAPFPASGSLRKNSLFSFSIQDPERGTRGLGGAAEGGSLLPLFLSCLGSALAPNLRRLLAAEPEILARTRGGRGSVSRALRPPWGEQGGCSGEGMLCGAAQSATVQPSPSTRAGDLVLIFTNFSSCRNVQKFSGLCSSAPAPAAPCLCMPRPRSCP